MVHQPNSGSCLLITQDTQRYVFIWRKKRRKKKEKKEKRKKKEEKEKDTVQAQRI
jgi:hypothetical protein